MIYNSKQNKSMEKNTKIIIILSAIICILLIWGSLFFADNYPQTFECDELKITTPIDYYTFKTIYQILKENENFQVKED